MLDVKGDTKITTITEEESRSKVKDLQLQGLVVVDPAKSKVVDAAAPELPEEAVAFYRVVGG